MNKTYVVKFFKAPDSASWGIPKGYSKGSKISFNTFRVGRYVLAWGTED